MRGKRIGLLCVWVSTVAVAAAAGSAGGQQVVLFVVDRVAWSDLAAEPLPGWDRLQREGALGMLNNMTYRGIGAGKVAVSLGAGHDADAADAVVQLYGVGEQMAGGLRAGETYTALTGDSPGKSRIVNPFVDKLRAVVEALPHEVHAGAVADILHEHDVRTNVLGCGDWVEPDGDRRWRRQALAVAMDSRGCVDVGHVGWAVLRATPDVPGGLITDAGAVLSGLRELRDAPTFTVIDYGDTARAAAWGGVVSAERAQTFRQDALRRADDCLLRLLGELDRNRDLLVALSMTPAPGASYEMQPIGVWGAGVKPGSTVTSASTRRPGVVTLSDVSATLLSAFDIDVPSTFQGRPFHYLPLALTPESLARRVSAVAVTDRKLRRSTLCIFAVAVGVVLGFGALCLLVPISSFRRVQPLVVSATLMLTAGPLAMLAAHPWVVWRPERASGYWPLAAVVAIALAWTSRAMCARSTTAVDGIAALTAFVIVVDVVTGARLSYGSVLGYSPYFGGRYYGLGNIVMGMLLGVGLHLAARCAMAQAGQAARAACLALTALVAVVLIGGGSFGANGGGALSALVGFIALAVVTLGVRPRLRNLALLAAAAMVLLVLLIGLDLRDGEASSHLGRLVAAVQERGLPALTQMIAIKIGVLGRSFRHAYWLVALTGMLAAAAACWWSERSAVAGGRAPAGPPTHLAPAITGVALAAVAATVLNDSGPATPVFVALYTTAAWLVAKLEAAMANGGGRAVFSAAAAGLHETAVNATPSSASDARDTATDGLTTQCSLQQEGRK